jgi:hypothetical protein
MIDATLARAGERDALPRDEALGALETVLAAVADGDARNQAARIVADLAASSSGARLVGTPSATDALLDLRSALTAPR